MHRARLASLALATVASTLGVTAIAETDANAQVRIKVGGRAHVRVGGRVRVRAPHVRWRVRRHAPPRVRVHVGGAIYVGGGWYGPRFAAPPPPPVYDDCNCEGNYHPVAPTAGVAVMAPPPRPSLPRFGLGLAAGGVDVQGEPAGDDVAVLARLRLTPRLLLEGEVGKSELEDGARVDRRLGASLVAELSPYNRFSPYLVGGLGVSQVEVDRGDYETSQEFAEIGVGLRLAVTPRLHVGADIRAGSRSATGEAEPLDATARMVTPDADDSEEYTRARLSGILYF